MSNRIDQLVALAFDPQATAAEFYERLVVLTIHECTYTLQRAVTRDGHTSENERTWCHLKDICKRFNMEVPTMYSTEFLNNYQEATK